MANVHREVGDNAWVEIKERGYPYKLQRQIREERGDDKTLELIIPFVTACHLPRADGEGFLDSLASASDLDDVEEAVVINVIREFFTFRQERLFNPVSPNS